MYSCHFCTKKFKNPSHLNLHMVCHTKEKPYKCLRCPVAFGHLSGLKSHIKSVHDGIKKIRKINYHCPMCSFKCYDKPNLRIHLQKHSSELPFSCDVPSCEFKTKYKRALLRHGLTVHSDEAFYECPTDGCNYRGKTKEYLRRHLRIHRNEKIFACTVAGCTYTCKMKDTLKSHTFRVHSVEKPFKCSFCDYRSNVSSNLVRHQLTHKKIKRFHCQDPNCGYTSHDKSQLKSHVDRKHKKKEVSCTEYGCNFRCASVTLLKEHLKRHELPLFKCPGDSCKYSTKSKASLAQHLYRYHEDAQSGMSVEPNLRDLEMAATASAMETLHCRFPSCGYQTKFPHHLDRHRITHKKKEKRKHACTFCFARFICLSDLNLHVQRHTGEKPYKCAYCDDKRVTSSELRRHAGNVHRIYVIPRGKEEEKRDCHTCNMTLSSYTEFVLHSMTHLRPIVVLERIRVHFD